MHSFFCPKWVTAMPFCLQSIDKSFGRLAVSVEWVTGWWFCPFKSLLTKTRVKPFCYFVLPAMNLKRICVLEKCSWLNLELPFPCFFFLPQFRFSQSSVVVIWNHRNQRNSYDVRRERKLNKQRWAICAQWNCSNFANRRCFFAFTVPSGS